MKFLPKTIFLLQKFKWPNLLLCLAVFSLPFNVRYILNFQEIKNIEGFREHLTLSIYPLEILIGLFCLWHLLVCLKNKTGKLLDRLWKKIALEAKKSAEKEISNPEVIILRKNPDIESFVDNSKFVIPAKASPKDSFWRAVIQNADKQNRLNQAISIKKVNQNNFKNQSSLWKKTKFIWKDWFFYFLIFLWAQFIFFHLKEPVVLWSTYRFSVAVIFYFLIKKSLQKEKTSLSCYANLVFFSGIFQVIVEMLQFELQHSLGLKYLGESVIAPTILGVAKFEIGPLKLIRAYGTFPHPNILGAFLILSLACGTWLLINRHQENSFFSKLFHLLGLGVILLGIILTFSRAALVTGFIFFTLTAFLNKERVFRFYLVICKKIRVPIIFQQALGILVFFGMSFGLYHFLGPRLCIANCQGDSMFNLRAVYFQTAETIIEKVPLTGIGLGNFTLLESNFSEFYLAPWEKQPVHNIFFLGAGEIGLIGFSLFLLGIFQRYFDLRKFSTVLKNPFALCLSLFLFMGFLDHYFWTLAQGQAIFFLTLAFCGFFCKIKS